MNQTFKATMSSFIRVGIANTKPLKRAACWYDADNSEWHADILGCLFRGKFGQCTDSPRYVQFALDRNFPQIRKQIDRTLIPDAVWHEPYPDCLGNVMMALQEDADWTREQIADWLESIGY